jgi:hypothetical protein
MGTFTGISVSTLLYFLSLPDASHVWPMPLLGLGTIGVTFLSLLAAALCFYVIKYLKGKTDSTNDDILDEMRVISEKFTINQQDSR